MLTNFEGTRLDAYHLIRRLGGGTFGDVYLAEDLRLDNLWPFYYHGDVYFHCGLAYEQTKQHWQALQDYVRVLELDSYDRSASDGKERVKKILKL